MNKWPKVMLKSDECGGWRVQAASHGTRLFRLRMIAAS
jgi:hypothetical protein